MGGNRRRDPRCYLRGLETIVMTHPDLGWIFRGEPGCYPDISSGLYRAYSSHTDDFVRLEESVVRDAGRFSDLNEDSQILAEVQHRGGRTNQIDFTEDLGIAAYFACQVDQSRKGEDGRIIMLPASDSGGLRHWDVSVTRTVRTPNRLAGMQRSVFVSSPRGRLPIEELHHSLVIVTIPAEDKLQMLDYLRFCRGIEAGTVFSDTMEYVRNQDDYIDHDVWLRKARDASDRGDCDGAIESVDRYLDRRFPVDGDDQGIREAYRIRGLSYYRVGRKTEAFKDLANRDLDLPEDIAEEVSQWARENGLYRESSDGAVTRSIHFKGLYDRHRPFDFTYQKKCRFRLKSGQEPDGMYIRLVTDRGDWVTSYGLGNFSEELGEIGGECAWCSVWGGGVEHVTNRLSLEAGVREMVVRHGSRDMVIEVEIVDEEGVRGKKRPE